MAWVIVTILLFAYLLITTETLTKVNRAAVAIFAAAVGWVLYALQWGVTRSAFLPYVGKASEIVLFLLATMTIVEILNNNGCFDFIRPLLRTRNSKKMLWMLAAVTFVISANLDNFTTTVMMLTIMHGIIPSRRHRMVFGSAIMIAANSGGALTVIGNTEGLALWNMSAVTATNFSLSLLIPCLVAWGLPTIYMSRLLPERVETEWIVMPYRGDDTRLNVWQRLLMLFVGIGGLWFIPTFHTLTNLSPFLGALCVLSILWIVNEIFNRKLMNMDMMVQRRTPQVLQYGVIQVMLFVMGIMLALGVVKETGALSAFMAFLADNGLLGETGYGIWGLGLLAGVISTVLDNFATAMTFFSFHDVNIQEFITIGHPLPALPNIYVQNGDYWKVIAYAVMAGGNVLTLGSVSGLALMKMERMHVGWYFKNIGWVALVAALVGFGLLWLELECIR